MIKTIKNFIGGLSYSDKLTQENQYYIGTGLDPNRFPGYIYAGYAPSTFSNSAAVTDLIVGLATYDNSATHKGYGIGTGGKFYEFTTGVGSENVTNAGNFPYTIPTSVGEDIIRYTCNSASVATEMIMFSYNTTGNSGYIGVMPAGNDGSNIDVDWSSTIVANSAVFTNNPHALISGADGNLYMADGYYINQIQGAVGANGTLNVNEFDVPKDYTIYCMENYGSYLAVGASTVQKNSDTYYYNKSAVYFWDFSSSSYNFVVPIEDNKIVALKNMNGSLYAVTMGRGTTGRGGVTLWIMDGDKFVKVRELRNGTTTTQVFNQNCVDVFRGQLAISTYNGIYLWGRIESVYPDALSVPFNNTGNDQCGVVKSMTGGGLWSSSFESPNYYIDVHESGSNVNAQLRTGVIDFGQKVILNYVKINFADKLVSGNTLNMTIVTDYGTDSYTNFISTFGAYLTFPADGAIRNKRFDNGISGIECTSVQIDLDNAAGNTTFPGIASIEIDYTPVDNTQYAE